MPWDNESRRKAELPPNWESEIRPRILLRDDHRCQWLRGGTGPHKRRRICGAPATDVDHIVRGLDHSDANLQSLCGYHHRWKTNQESAEVRRELAQKARHPVERPVGLR